MLLWGFEGAVDVVNVINFLGLGGMKKADSRELFFLFGMMATEAPCTRLKRGCITIDNVDVKLGGLGENKKAAVNKSVA
jgi:hypothetical protein